MARLKEIYKNDVVPALVKQFGYKSVMEVPRLQKIVLNMGVGEAIGDKKLLENAAGDMQKISGQKPVITKARKAIAVFKIREATDRLHGDAAPGADVRVPRPPDLGRAARVRDFRGVSGRSFDGRGNFNMASRSRSSSRRSSTTRSTSCGDEHHDHHDREDGRRGQGAPGRVPFPFKN